jgi:hypothetical protein
MAVYLEKIAMPGAPRSTVVAPKQEKKARLSERSRAATETTFAFSKHRRIEHYGLIASQTGVVEPE